MSLRVLVIGGGAFGSRLVRGLVATSDFDVVIGGRHLDKAEALAAELRTSHPGQAVEAIAIDRGAVTAEGLRALDLFAVVDAAGPFQSADMALAEAAIDAEVHYVDLADARDFVAAFPKLDATAKAAGVTAVAGASSTPALSHAALDRITGGWQAIDTVEVAISPGNRAPRGLSVVVAILSYAGRPVRVFLNGEWCTRPGWGMLTRRAFVGLGRRWLSLCETPDLDLVPKRFQVRRSAIFRAGLELSVLHLGLWAASLVVRAELIRSLRPFAGAFRALADLFTGFGTDRGGMLVEAGGVDAEGRKVRARWTLVAEAGDGPVIPTLPALALLRRLADGGVPPGASACVGLLGLEEIEAEFRPYRIRTRIDVVRDGDDLFVKALSDDFDVMPEPIRAAHRTGRRLVLRGEASVAGAEGAAGRAIAGLFRLPQATSGRIPVTVTMEARGRQEIWTRDFGGGRFRSVLGLRSEGGMTERFGPFTFELDVPPSAAGLEMIITGWRCGPLRLPRRLAPFATAEERVDEAGRFRFDVAIGLPFVGRIVGYRGWLVPVEDAAS
jgi:hypothetical protein